MRCENVSGRLASSHNQAGAGQLSSICVTAIGGCPWRWLLCTLRHMEQREIDLWHIRRALELARRGQGFVEPNPMVGCVIAQGAEIIGEGWHRRFGRPMPRWRPCASPATARPAARSTSPSSPVATTAKRHPAPKAVLAAGIRRVVVGHARSFPASGRRRHGRTAGRRRRVEVGLLETKPARLNAPYLRLLETGRPWIIAKWAMTLDGKIATRTGQSQWISDAEIARDRPRAARPSRCHHGRSGDGRRDDPLLTARPPGRALPPVWCSIPRHRCARKPVGPHGREAPVLVAVAAKRRAADCRRLRDAGCEVFVCGGETHAARLDALLAEFGRRRLTNVMVEGGGRLLGSLLDAWQIDEVHVFIAPKLVGGASAATADRRPRDRRNFRGPMSRIAASAAIGRRHLHHGPMRRRILRVQVTRGPRTV